VLEGYKGFMSRNFKVDRSRGDQQLIPAPRLRPGCCAAAELPGNYFDFNKLAVEMTDGSQLGGGLAIVLPQRNTGVMALLGTQNVRWYLRRRHRHVYYLVACWRVTAAHSR